MEGVVTMNKELMKKEISKYLGVKYGVRLEEAEAFQIFNALSLTLMGEIVEDWRKTSETYKDVKQASYLSAEFLMGRALGNNLVNL